MTTKVGDNLHALVSQFIEVPKEPPCCSVRHTINAYGPELTSKHMKSLVQVLRTSKPFIKCNIQTSDHTIYLFVRKAIRMTGVDMGKLDRYNFSRTIY